MALINQNQNCGDSGNPKNWGLGTCTGGSRKLEDAIFFSQSPFPVAAADLANMPEWLDDNLHAASMADRVQYFTNVKEVSNNNAEAQKFTYADGSEVETTPSKNRRVYRVDSDCLHSAIRSWNNKSGYLLFVDKDGGLDGAKGTVAGEKVLYPCKVSRIYAEDVILPTNSEPAGYMITVEFENVNELNEDSVHVGADKFKDGNGNAFSLKTGIAELVTQEVTLDNTNSGTPGSGIFDIAPFSGACEENNLALLFGATIATAARWVVSNDATGGVIPPTTVALGANNERIRFTLPTGNANYPASGGRIRIRQTSIQDWATQGMEWYEAEPIIITIP